ncbi:phage holin family protein [Roseococcus pinisoli]|uniref:Phage holin family protein n=1 Tax=Roseococcus pinisoli TaxID=2835040 RepID=A0ABS5QAC5_9PROT|nr:phage holin family protein [Roseococcus pinisoli]MBS7810383.1 phage holin family protein [Roseococcus pinisoli]
MRSLRLLGAAAEAEALRLKREAGSFARSTLLQVAAGLFGLAALGLLHVAAWLWLQPSQGALWATLWLALADLVVMGVLLLLSRRRYDPVAQEALMLRRQTMAQLRAVSPMDEALSLVRWRGLVDIGALVVGQFMKRRR